MTIKENLMERKIGERYFLNSSDNGNCVYIMNETTYKIYSLIKDEIDISEIIDRLFDEFDVDKIELETDVNACIKDMINAGVIIQ